MENKNKKDIKNEVENTKTAEEQAKAKVENILKKAKEKGKITYGELASELDDINQEQI